MDDNLKIELKKLIDYQKKDRELRMLNATIERDDALSEMNKNKRAFNDAKQRLSDSEQNAGSIVEAYGDLRKYIDDNQSLLDEAENIDAQSEEELEELVKKLESLKSKFQAADKKASDLEKRAKDVCLDRSKALNTGKAAKTRYAAAKEKHEKLVGSKADELHRLTSELDKLRASLDAKMFDEYKKLDEENKFPPIVPAAAGDERKGMYSCGGCGLALSQQSNTLLKDNGWCRCDTCRRIIYKMD